MTKIRDRFADETVENVKERLQKDFDSDVDTRQGSLVGDLTSGIAEEFASAYSMLDFFLKAVILNEDMPSDFLALKAKEYGIDRYEANPAKVEVTFTGAEGETIPAGTVVRTSREPALEYATSKNVIIGDSEEVIVEAVSTAGGAEYNVSAYQIDAVVGDLAGVLEVENRESAEGGYDEQSDADLYEQVLNTIRRPITSGNVYHYEKWATDVDGIRRAKVYPLWDGPGTVKVVLLAANGVSPTEEKVEEVEEYIEQERPIGADVTVVGATEIEANIEGTLVIKDGYSIEVITQEYKEALRDIFADTAFRTDVIRYARVAALILDIDGVIDWQDLTLNGGAINVSLSDEEIPVVGEVVFDVAD